MTESLDSNEHLKERRSLVDGLRESPSWVPIFTAPYEPGTSGGETDEPAGGLPEYGESLVSGDQLEEFVYGPPAPPWILPHGLLPHGLLLEEESNGADAVAGEAASIRGVSFRPEEQITHVFSPTDGLTEMVPASGPVLLLTQERLVAFCHADARRETYLVPVAEVKHVVVKSGSRSATNVAQGVLMVIAGIFIYLALGYWLAGQLGGPTIPVLHMDISSLIALVLVVSGMGMLAQVYFARLDGAITFQGEGLQFTFPFRGSSAQRHAFDLVNTTFEARRLKLSDRADGAGVDQGPAEPDTDVDEAVVDSDDVEPTAMAREDGAGESAAEESAVGDSAAGEAQPLGLRPSAQE